ncbi:MAG: HTH domain-containing protein [Parasporobacterium sp.]|nr:HTH domain-containing protein [Parasporobacterium sp.]
MESLKYVLLNLWTRHKKASEYSERIAIAIKILRLIKSRSGISSKDLAEILSISKRSTQRYIETLRVAGEWIEYDPARHGWVLFDNKSLLLEEDL